jgi:mono/diheme cytochrome c family protein
VTAAPPAPRHVLPKTIEGVGYSRPRGMRLLTFSFMAAAALTASLRAAPDFKKDIRPLLENYCLSCHDDAAKGGLNLEALSEESAFWRDPKAWEKVLAQLRDHGMPPGKKTQPKPEERAALVDWLHGALANPDPKKVPRDPGRAVIHRLSRQEYNLTIRDLLGVDTKPADSFPPDGGGGAGFDNNASTLFVPPILMEKYLSAAGAIIAAAKPERLFRVRPAPGKDERVAAKESLEYLAARAFRRPVEPQEMAGLLRLYDASRKSGEPWEEGVRLGVRAILVSPSFLFRIERSTPIRPGGEEVLDDWSLAARLSYFMWSSMPDDTLLGLAATKKLREPAVLEAQVRRMLADPKARAIAENFGSQWLKTKELHHITNPSKDKFPEYTPALRDAMAEEPVAFLGALLRENRPLTDCLDADYTYANAALAKHYGLPEVKGDAMQRVALTDRNRGGVATMAGVLTLTSYPRRTSPVLRGKWIMEEILGTPPPPPPAMIKTLPTSDRARDGLTFRQQLERHRADPQCAGCHKAMDQLGFGLENFDGVGKWRTEIAKQPIDTAGELPTGEKFSTPAELKKVLLARKADFTRTITEKMLAYALGRGVENGDWLTVQQISKAVAADGYKAQRLILEIAKSHPFNYRRPNEAPKTASTP